MSKPDTVTRPDLLDTLPRVDSGSRDPEKLIETMNRLTAELKAAKPITQPEVSP